MASAACASARPSVCRPTFALGRPRSPCLTRPGGGGGRLRRASLGVGRVGGPIRRRGTTTRGRSPCPPTQHPPPSRKIALPRRSRVFRPPLALISLSFPLCRFAPAALRGDHQQTRPIFCSTQDCRTRTARAATNAKNKCRPTIPSGADSKCCCTRCARCRPTTTANGPDHREDNQRPEHCCRLRRRPAARQLLGDGRSSQTASINPRHP